MVDLRALFVGILGGIIAYYATRGIDRYLARRTVLGRRRRIKQLSQELQQLESLGVTDRALLLFALRMLFGMIALAAVGAGGSAVFSLLNSPPNDAAVLILVSFVIAILAIYASGVFQKLDDPEPSLAKIRGKLSELQAMDDHPEPMRNPPTSANGPTA